MIVLLLDLYMCRRVHMICPTAPSETKICTERHLADVITCAKCQYEIFRGYDFTGVEFPIFLLIFAWAL